MGQKVNPNGFRVGIIRDWESTWFDEKNYAKYVHQDEQIRKYLVKELKDAFVSKVKIERTAGSIKIVILTARPGVVLGQNGDNLKELEKRISRIEDKGTSIKMDVAEVANVDLDAQVVADMIARQLENRANFRITQKQAIRNVMKSGAKGIKTKISGRLGGVEMARSEGYSEGQVPLQTIRADIDYALAEALTTYGLLGVKVWIYKGEVLPDKETK